MIGALVHDKIGATYTVVDKRLTGEGPNSPVSYRIECQTPGTADPSRVGTFMWIARAVLESTAAKIERRKL